MSRIDVMKSVAEQVYDGYGVSGEVGIAYFEKFYADLIEFDFKSILRHMMNCYPHRFVLDFILSSPRLWLGLPATIWIEILNSSDLRLDTSTIDDQVAQYADIEFLSKYVGVDALRYLIEESNISIADKSLALAYFNKDAYGLVPSTLDDEDLDGIYFVRKDELVSLQATLCSSFGFCRVHCTEESVYEYIEVINDKFRLLSR
jgi:hypothetical protein